jgi:cytochrome c peroxidase
MVATFYSIINKGDIMRKTKIKKKRFKFLIGITMLIFGMCMLFGYAAETRSDFNPDSYLTDIELLGKYVFFDKISEPQRMACVTCHDPATGGTGSVSGVNLHQVAITGANPHTVGNLKPPTNAYATFILDFQPCNSGGLGPLGLQDYCFGNFWNGRAEGRTLGSADQLFPDGATKHIGDEIFYATDGTPLLGVGGYSIYFGPVADQALNPMPNTVEQNIQRKAVCEHVASARYAELYERVWGVEIDCSEDVVTEKADDVALEKAFDISFKRLMLAVCAWQDSKDLNSFSSKRDKALRAELACACAEGTGSPNYPGLEVCEVVGYTGDPSVCDDPDYTNSPGVFPLVWLTAQENYGHDLFYATRFSPLNVGTEEDPVLKFSNCAFCHADNPVLPGPGPKDTGDELLQLYSADDYHNIGTPRNPEIPDTGVDPDLGIAGHVYVDDGDGENDYPPGFFKTPTLRNVNKRKGEGFIKAYTHNGWFKSMESIVHFYNTAAVGLPTANSFDVTRCPDGIVTEKDALANNCWPTPAYGGGAIPFLVGDLGLTAEDEAAIVAYLKTLTDEHTAQAPRPYASSRRR